MTDTLPAAELPLFPLQTVLFPDGRLDLKIFEARYLDLVSACLRESRPFGVVALKAGGEARTGPEPVTLHDAGALAELVDVDSAQAGILVVRCRGSHRFTIEAPRQRADGLWVARATPLADDPLLAPRDAHGNAVKSLARAIEALAAQGAEPFLTPYRFDDAGWVANRWCEILPLPLEARQLLLSLPDPLARLATVDAILRAHQPAPA
ncbi:MAG: LON peptidase substrate-binding domain-containing protein [Caldimonas sp.]